MPASPKSLSIRTYQVGFGDCFLLSFEYGSGNEKHVLVDFGSTSLPKDAPKTRMMDIALDIKKRTNGKLDAVVATHRHKDHISGFETKAGGKGTGDVIRSLKPDVVVQPWTENPKLEKEATGPKAKSLAGSKRLSAASAHISALTQMHEVAGQSLAAAKNARYFSSALREQLRFLGEDNLKNLSAVKNLMNMAPNEYVFSGSDSGLGKVLPGVGIDVLGPPTVKQTDTIKKQRAKDPDEFWHFQAKFWLYQAKALQLAGPSGSSKSILFPRHVSSHGPNFPVDARWLIHHARATQGSQLLQIVRMLDKAMNNTSVVLVLQVGNKRMLFPGDAQIENWQFALGQEKYAKLLTSVNLYKVGHHGSLNATPKSLWKLFKNRSKNPAASKRMISLMSTMEGKHGSEDSNTEVPRQTLVSALKSETKHFSTQQLKKGKFFEDTVIKF